MPNEPSVAEPEGWAPEAAWAAGFLDAVWLPEPGVSTKLGADLARDVSSSSDPDRSCTVWVMTHVDGGATGATSALGL